ncbi:MAG: hypothetical protein QOK04_160 [Solirubrobacteraceae bacterium]|jgi:hypothetical protein|nr:hypothetical protein [Solirubrobacteraceae bacterium]
MTTLLADRVRSGADATTGARDAGGEVTLESLLSGVWEDLAARASAACLVCGGELAGSPQLGAPARCRDCGSELD